MNERINKTLSISRSGRLLLSAYVANTYFSRLRGLFACPPLGEHDALVLHTCSAVHTFGFRHGIDVVFVGGDGKVLKCVEMPANTLRFCPGAQSVIEMSSGTLQRLNVSVGQQLLMHAGEKACG